MTQNFTTLQEAKQFLRDNFEKGELCPCCGQLVKLYKINLGVGMARVLIEMYRLTAASTEVVRWIHPISELRTVNGDYAKLRIWGLVEEKGDDVPDDKKASGYWRITSKGMDFVNDSLTVQKKAHIFNNRCLGFSGEQIGIKQALGTKFDYHELMKGF